MTTECNEAADKTHINPVFANCRSMDDFRKAVRTLLPNEPETAIDSVAANVHVIVRAYRLARPGSYS